MDLVGRGDTLDTFGQVLGSVADGASAGLRLAGEPGIGKSRLLAELGGQARSLGFQVLSGRASEFERDAPFMVFVDALDDHLAGLGPKLTRALPAAVVELLSAVFPAIPAPSGASAQRVGAERYRIYRAVRSLLDELAKTAPVALLLDDLHWADDSSAELFAHLLTYPPPQRVLIATAYRPAQLGERPRAAVERAVREERLTAIDIAPLSRAEAQQLLGRGGSEALDALYTESGGNPFYLLELAREQRPLDGHGGWHGSGVPAVVVAAMNLEIAALPDDARQVAQGAAVAGETFTASAAATAVDVDVATALPLVDGLVADGLLVPSEVPQRFRFRHPVVRRAVYDSAGASRRIVMHRRLARDLQARDASPVELAHHLEVAAEPGDQAAINVLTAAGHELAGTAPAIAAKRFAAALRLLRPGDNGRRVELLIPLASARRAGGELRASRDALVEALSCVPADAVADRVRLTALCGAVETDLGLIAEAHTRLRRAWGAMPERTSVLAAELLIELAINAYHRRDWAGQLSYAGDALAAARRLGTRQIEAMALTMHAFAEFGAGRFERAQTALDEAAQVVDDLTDQELAARLDVTAVLSLCEFFLERFEAAVRHADRGLALSRSTGQAQSFHAHLQARVVPLGLLGRLDEALEGAREAEASARLIGVDQVLLTALMGVVHGSLAVGDLPAAISAGEEGLALARSLPPTEPGAVLAWGTALALLESGQPGRAAVVLFDGPAATAMTPNASCCVWGLAARIEAERGRFDQAWRWVDRLDARRDQLAGLRFPRYWAERARAQVLLAQGDTVSAARSALAAVAVNAASRYEASEARLLAGRALAAAGERAEAVAQLQQARSEFEEYGAVRHRDEAVRELRRLGERVGRGGRRTTGDAGADALSDRERQIAEMVSDGRTNKEIGDALLISTRTVERHLSHVFDKLSVSSRAQLGAEFHRLRS